MTARVNLKIAKSLLRYYSEHIAYLKEVDSKCGKYRVAFGIFYYGDTSRVIHYTTDYLTSKNSYRFMCSL